MALETLGQNTTITEFLAPEFTHRHEKIIGSDLSPNDEEWNRGFELLTRYRTMYSAEHFLPIAKAMKAIDPKKIIEFGLSERDWNMTYEKYLHNSHPDTFFSGISNAKILFPEKVELLKNNSTRWNRSKEKLDIKDLIFVKDWPANLLSAMNLYLYDPNRFMSELSFPEKLIKDLQEALQSTTYATSSAHAFAALRLLNNTEPPFLPSMSQWENMIAGRESLRNLMMHHSYEHKDWAAAEFFSQTYYLKIISSEEVKVTDGGVKLFTSPVKNNVTLPEMRKF